MFNFGGGAGPGNSGVFQGALSSTRGVTPQDMNRLIEAYKKEGRPLPNLNPAQGTNPVPLAVGLGSMGQVGNMEGMKLAHGSHDPTFTINGIPRYRTPGGHNPADHNCPVGPDGKKIEALCPKDKDIPLIKAKEMLKGFIA
tara:strand:- start:3 stop:425 length:423 start_codon:yes stop_codon:yes gene_type:complete